MAKSKTARNGNKCKVISSKEKKIPLPVLNKHNKALKFSCSICGKKFSQNAFLKIHLRSHTDERPFRCEVCNKAFHQRSHLRYHQVTHSADSKHKCNICGKALRYKQSLKLHLKIHNNDPKFQCDMCEKSFFEKPKLKIHRRIHTGEKPYICTICGRGFAQKGNCKKHNEKYHARDKDRKYPCTLCSKSFIWKKCLLMHIKLHELNFDDELKSSRNKSSQTSISLKENMIEFLPLLMDEGLLLEIGWPKISIEEAVIKVLIWCEQEPVPSLIKNEFQGNVKLLLDLVLAEKFTEMRGIADKSPNEIIMTLINAKNRLK